MYLKRDRRIKCTAIKQRQTIVINTMLFLLLLFLQTIFVNSDSKNMKDDHFHRFEVGSRGIKYVQKHDFLGKLL